MTNVREYNHIDTFLGPGGSKTDKIESCLEKLKVSELEQINEAAIFRRSRPRSYWGLA